MAALLDDLQHLPAGSHCVSFHASEEEAARHAVSFLSGAEPSTGVRYWVPDERLRSYYDHWLAAEAPRQVGCVAVLTHEQVAPGADGELRPVPEVLEFVRAHPEGVTAAGDTLSRYWSAENLPEHLEYEEWFDQQPRAHSRFLCPYDLRRIPPGSAPEALAKLTDAHSHVVLSASREPGVRLLQLFLFHPVERLPEALDENLGWAVRRGLIELDGRREALSLTPAGERIVEEWSARAILDW